MGDFQSVLTLSAEVAALCSEFMQLMKFINSTTMSTFFMMCMSHGVNANNLPGVFLWRLRCQL